MLTAEIIDRNKVFVSSRVHSIDFLRGMVMVLMALDHVRTFLHEDFYQFNAEDLSQTTPVLFFTRWVTHFCAPVFIFLVGTSASLMLQKTRSKMEVSRFLMSRGLFLIALELTLFRMCWSSPANFFQPFVSLLVIWAIGISMIALAALIHAPYRAVLIIGLVILFFHNTLSPVSFAEGSPMATFWAFFYSGGNGAIGNVGVFFLYPILPFIGLVALGFCLGYLYTPDVAPERRRRLLLMMGGVAILLFVVLRYFNIYGDPQPWEAGKNSMYSFMAFLRTTKYPVSLLYCLMTLGPALIILAWIEGVRNKVVQFFATIGAVPMFYYILHLVFIAVIAGIAGRNAFGLLAVYGFFFFVVALLYLLCRWYAKYKSQHPDKKWLMYL
jgi:uncharacterized membrane protein